MNADEINALVERLRSCSASYEPERAVLMMRDAADALAALQAENASLRQTLREIANADTVAWDDPTEYEAWAKSRARWALGKVDKDPK
jgi:hypothetical protein